LSPEEAIPYVDIAVILVNHKEFYQLDFSDKIVLDTKGIMPK